MNCTLVILDLFPNQAYVDPKPCPEQSLVEDFPLGRFMRFLKHIKLKKLLSSITDMKAYEYLSLLEDYSKTLGVIAWPVDFEGEDPFEVIESYIQMLEKFQSKTSFSNEEVEYYMHIFKKMQKVKKK